MKIIKLLSFCLLFFTTNTLSAQVKIQVNLGSPPQWGPIGYTNVRYYYLPDIEAYYDITNGVFIYFDNGIWVRRNYLPYRYRNYDLYGGY